MDEEFQLYEQQADPQELLLCPQSSITFRSISYDLYFCTFNNTFKITLPDTIILTHRNNGKEQ